VRASERAVKSLPGLACCAPLLLPGLLALSACTSARSANQAEVERIAAAHEREVQETLVASRRFAVENPAPQSRDFEADGTLVLHELGLAGSTGRELLRVRYTWVNTTDETIELAVVQLSLRDPVSGNEWSEDRVLRLPLGLEFVPGSSYSDELRLFTGGVHRRPGWSWDIDVRVLR
jgi:hypothetical protein